MESFLQLLENDEIAPKLVAKEENIGNPIGALLFFSLLAGYIYDTEAAKQQGSSCLGPNYFRLTFLFLAGVCGLGTILSIILTIRIRPVYQMLYVGVPFVYHKVLVTDKWRF